MEQYDQIGARLDRLPLARFHYRIFGIISFSLLLTGFELFRQCCFSKAGKQWMVK